MNPLTAAPDPDAVAAVSLACPLVAAMSGGVLGEVATYLPGRRVHGVRLGADGIEVHVIGVFGPRMSDIADQVRAAVQPLAPGQAVSVHIDDLADPAPTSPSASPR